jgi:hypothetical protein
MQVMVLVLLLLQNCCQRDVLSNLRAAWQYTPPKANETNITTLITLCNKDIIIHGKARIKLTAVACSGISFWRFLLENVLLGTRQGIS